MSKFPLRHGHVFDEPTPTGGRRGSWTRAYWRWADAIEFVEPDDDAAAYEHYRDCVRRCGGGARRAGEEGRRVRRAAGVEAGRGRAQVREGRRRRHRVPARLRDGRPRPVPERAVVRLVVRARALGALERRDLVEGGITRAGNAHVRRALVESAWHVPMSSRDPKPLAPGQEVAPAVRRHATKCNRRLIERRRPWPPPAEAVRGQLRHGARDGVLGVGDSADGGLVARAPRTTGSDPGARRARGRWEATRVLLWAAGDRHARQQTPISPRGPQP